MSIMGRASLEVDVRSRGVPSAAPSSHSPFSPFPPCCPGAVVCLAHRPKRSSREKAINCARLLFPVNTYSVCRILRSTIGRETVGETVRPRVPSIVDDDRHRTPGRAQMRQATTCFLDLGLCCTSSCAIFRSSSAAAPVWYCLSPGVPRTRVIDSLQKPWTTLSSCATAREHVVPMHNISFSAPSCHTASVLFAFR